MTKSQQKVSSIEKLSNQEGIISALAFDQRGALKRMMAEHQSETPTVEQIEQLKVLVSEELTQYASSILLDPEYGLPASDARNNDCGLLLAYEKTGYDVNAKGRLPDCLVEWSAKRLKEQGANAVKFLLYYDVDDTEEINIQKKAYIERIGSECVAEDIPFFLEVLTYDDNIPDNKSAEFADGFKEASKQLAQWVQENKIKTQVSVEDGFDKVPQAFRNLLTGDNFGKQVIKVASE
ncbi:tagatose 1,6-diphosphate aldolase [Staphylococcus epidermidis]|nr:tagatose 1,6-diphosphate aldolase [Staphylococcus epidermidis]